MAISIRLNGIAPLADKTAVKLERSYDRTTTSYEVCVWRTFAPPTALRGGVSREDLLDFYS